MWVRSLGVKIPWRKARQPTPVFLPGESRGQRGIEGYSPQGHKDLAHMSWGVEKSFRRQQTWTDKRNGPWRSHQTSEIHCGGRAQVTWGYGLSTQVLCPVSLHSSEKQGFSQETLEKQGFHFNDCSWGCPWVLDHHCNLGRLHRGVASHPLEFERTILHRAFFFFSLCFSELHALYLDTNLLCTSCTGMWKTEIGASGCFLRGLPQSQQCLSSSHLLCVPVPSIFSPFC